MSTARDITQGLTPDHFEHDDGACITVLAHNECQCYATTDAGTVYLFSDGSTLHVTAEQWSLTITPDTEPGDWQWNMHPPPAVVGECDGCGERDGCKCAEYYHEVYECVPFIRGGAM